MLPTYCLEILKVVTQGEETQVEASRHLELKSPSQLEFTRPSIGEERTAKRENPNDQQRNLLEQSVKYRSVHSCVEITQSQSQRVKTKTIKKD